MSWCNRRFFLMSGLALLAGCGFAPAYGPGGAGSALMGRVAVEAPDTRASYLLTQEIETRLGRPANPRYALIPAVRVNTQAMAINRNNVASRFNLLGTVAYSLRDLETGVIVTSSEVTSFTGYSATGTTVAVQAAERDAEARLMAILADQVLTRLLAADLPQPE
ncbi:Lipopolysaccharide-assembly [Roseovarius sp. EC-HK134]|uniref:LPS assembly lipoprotein LptE n=1 Tax=unclassified Roseovarius TaxID=2614913 RepID=UPI001253325C|nr:MULTISPECIES: LPS assembly lipoprotein LptE [unclassified Roseovarius]VVT19819.1 Lipopolysaccharide-assembly [Roseovarius sp. EC-SD190]VVT19943.1 Lipopolysaccharide-assembly [Roseovarius sp. EC-HK134]